MAHERSLAMRVAWEDGYLNRYDFGYRSGLRLFERYDHAMLCAVTQEAALLRDSLLSISNPVISTPVRN